MCALTIAAVSMAAVRAEAQIVKAPRTPSPAGEFVPLTIILPPSWDSRSVTFEARGVSEDTFLHRAFRTTNDCPADAACYWSALRTDFRLSAGEYDLTFVATDGQGRTRSFTGSFFVGKPQDDDHDGMPTYWEGNHGLDTRSAEGEHGATGDPDGDGVSNLEEFRRGTHPRTRYVQYFGESSAGDRQGMFPCVYPARQDGQFGQVRIRLIGDDGRQIVDDTQTFPLGYARCPMRLGFYVADRVVAIEVESEMPIAVERSLERSIPDANVFDRRELFFAQPAVQPSREWHFAQGTTSAPVDVFLLAYNPQDTEVVAEYVFYGAANEPARITTRTLAPHARTTLWVNADEPRLAGGDRAVAIRASAPILMDRGLRWHPPGRTVPHESASAGAPATSARWYFPHVDALRQSDERLVIGNPTEHPTTVELTILHGVRAPAVSRVAVGPMSQVSVRPADFGRDAIVGVIATSTTGVPVVIELAQRGLGSSEGRWEFSAPGTTEAATTWLVPNLLFASNSFPRDNAAERGLVLMNPSSADAEVEIVGNYEDLSETARTARYLVRVGAGTVRVVGFANVQPSADTDLSGVLSMRLRQAVVRSLPGRDGAPAPPIVVARTSRVAAGGTGGARAEHTIAVRLP